MTEVVAIHSFKGGNGKSVVASTLAYYTATVLGQKTILVDCDLTAPSLNNLVSPLKPPEKTLTDLFSPNQDLEEVIQQSNHQNFHLIYAPNPSKGKEFLNQDQKWHTKALQTFFKIKNQLTDNLGYEWIIFDNQSGVSLTAANFLALSTSTVVLLRPSQYAAEGTLNLCKEIFKRLRLFSEKENRKDLLVWNQIPIGRQETEVRELIEEWNTLYVEAGVSPIAIIPYMSELSAAMFLGRENLSVEKIYPFLAPYIETVVEALSSGFTVAKT